MGLLFLRSVWLRKKNDRLSVQSLPLWGRWHGEAVTEEGSTMFRKILHFGAFLPLPPPYGGTLPKGEGMAAFRC